MCRIFLKGGSIVFVEEVDGTSSYQSFNSERPKSNLEDKDVLESLLAFVKDTMLNGKEFAKDLNVLCFDAKWVYESMLSSFKNILAGGGLVLVENKYLFIYRRGFWDLPKGKSEKGETIEETSLREVMEETSIEKLELGTHLCTTFHFMLNPKNSYEIQIKHTEWFNMASTMDACQNLKAQTEEGIEAIRLLSPEMALALEDSMYPSIAYVCKIAF